MTAVATETATATWVVVHGSSDIYWRCQLPARMLGAKTIVIHDHIDDLMNDGAEAGEGRFRWFFDDDTPSGASYPDLEGTVVFTRTDKVRAVHAAALTANGQRAVTEVD